MNVSDSPAQADFRAQVRAWIASDVPPHLKGQRQGIVQGPGIGPEDHRLLEAALARRGWLAPAYPKEVGGGGLAPDELLIFWEELFSAGVPYLEQSALIHFCQTLLHVGTPYQKEKFLRPTLEGRIIWSQGSSEPNAGSDLASLQTRAEVVEGGFRVTGQKIWTSHAHEADYLFMQVRTDPTAPRKWDGISMLIVDARSPGITVRPIQTIDDHHHFNETFYDDVFVPAENLVGELHKGWALVKYNLGFERFFHNVTEPTRIRRGLENFRDAARGTPGPGGTAWDDPELKRRAAALAMQADCFRYTRYRAVTRFARGEKPGNETMFFKFVGGELWQDIVGAHHEALGPAGLAWDDEPFGHEVAEAARHAANIRAATIRGGTAEIQRNIVAKRVLGLPE